MTVWFSSQLPKRAQAPKGHSSSLNKSYRINENLYESLRKNVLPITIRDKIIENHLKDLKDHENDRGLGISLRSPLRKSLQSDAKDKLQQKTEALNSERVKAKSVQGISKKESDEIPAEYKIPLINSACIEEERLQTPCFSRKNDDQIGQLKDLCDKLLIEQEEFRRKIKKQQLIITRLNKSADRSSGINKNVLPAIAKVQYGRFNTRQKSRTGDHAELHEFSEAKLESSYSPIELKEDSFIHSPKGLYEKVNEYPLMLFNKLEKIAMAPKVPSRYYKDKPKIRRVFRFPKEVFTPK